MAALPTGPKASLHELHLKPGHQPPIIQGCLLKIITYERISSTNTMAKALAQKGAADWTVVVSEVQTQGIGRSGRSWKSPKGGLWFSLIIRPKIPTDRIPILQFWVANALRTGIEEVCGVQSEVKWPNDLVVNWKKLAGILIKTKISGPELVYAIAGIGLNVNLTAEEGQYKTLRDENAVVGNWWKHCAHRMKPVIIETSNSRVRGKSVGVNFDGSIIVQTDQGSVTVPDGTLRLDT